VQKIWILGAGGQLGRALCRAFGDHARAIHTDALDFLAPHFSDNFQALLQDAPPSLVINAAAYTNVAQAENEAEIAKQINGIAPEIIAQQLAKISIPFMHTSTDYVFSGGKQSPYIESDETAPLNAYGKSKLWGEQAVLKAYPQAHILRYSWVYDASAPNFLTTMLGLMAAQKNLRIVANQVGAPSFAGDLAAATQKFALQVLSARPPASGIYHCCAGGHTSWHGFAVAITQMIRENNLPCAVENITPILADEFSSDIKRPENSRLSTQKLAALGIVLPHWRNGLVRAMQDMLAFSDANH
jgi:dTDP-4-dehydrorhamnose reductase